MQTATLATLRVGIAILPIQLLEGTVEILLTLGIERGHRHIPSEAVDSAIAQTGDTAALNSIRNRIRHLRCIVG